MISRVFKSEILLLLASVIWGFAFVAQRVSMEHIGPYTFNAVRFALGAIVLLPFAIRSTRKRTETGGRLVLISGCAAGAILFLGASLQQTGIVSTTAGKAGFITGLYVIIVPILGLAFGHRTKIGTWAGIVIASAGLYLLSFTGRFSIGSGDLLVLGGTFFWASHVIFVAVVIRKVNPLLLAMIQFLACSLLSFIMAMIFETVETAGLRNAIIPILYGGLLSVGVAYTLQLIAQRRTPPSHAAIILSLETVFAAIGGWLILGEIIPGRGLIGCALMLAGILVSQSGVRSED